MLSSNVTLRQKGDWLQVAIALANSAPIGWPMARLKQTYSADL
jgi:hypothetical protein